jgi:Ala-tRNA(Pro) deacylase
MPCESLKDFLDSHGVKYVVISHSKAYTANEVAAMVHVSGKEMAKAVMVKVDGRMAMAVLPASFRISFDQLRDAIGARGVTLASEEEFKELFPDCEVGAMPPFGNLYHMEVFVADALAEDEQIAFNAGTHTEIIRMNYADFDRLTQPQVMTFAAQQV